MPSVLGRIEERPCAADNDAPPGGQRLSIFIEGDLLHATTGCMPICLTPRKPILSEPWKYQHTLPIKARGHFRKTVKLSAAEERGLTEQKRHFLA